MVQTDEWVAARHVIQWNLCVHRGLARLSLTKSHACSQTLAKNVTQTHALEKPGTLAFHIRWT